MKVKVTMDLSTKVAKDWLAGKVDISNAVVRSRDTGKILKYVKLGTENTIDNAKKVASKVTGKNLVIGLGVTAAVVTIGGIINLVINKKNDKESVGIPKCINDFQKYFHKYLKETQKGVINIKSIDSLMSSLDKVEEVKREEIGIDFSTDEIRNILERIYDFTIKINEEYSGEKIKMKLPSKNSSKNIICLKDYLENQKQVIEKIS